MPVIHLRTGKFIFEGWVSFLSWKTKRSVSSQMGLNKMALNGFSFPHYLGKN